MTEEQARLLDWIDSFIYKHYRTPLFVEVMHSGLYESASLLIADRDALITAGRLISTSTVLDFVPYWMRPIIEMRKASAQEFKKLLKELMNTLRGG